MALCHFIATIEPQNTTKMFKSARDRNAKSWFLPLPHLHQPTEIFIFGFVLGCCGFRATCHRNFHSLFFQLSSWSHSHTRLIELSTLIRMQFGEFEYRCNCMPSFPLSLSSSHHVGAAIFSSENPIISIILLHLSTPRHFHLQSFDKRNFSIHAFIANTWCFFSSTLKPSFACSLFSHKRQNKQPAAKVLIALEARAHTTPHACTHTHGISSALSTYHFTWTANYTHFPFGACFLCAVAFPDWDLSKQKIYCFCQRPY